MFLVWPSAAFRSASRAALAAAIAASPILTSASHAEGTAAGAEFAVTVTTTYSYDNVSYTPAAISRTIKVNKLVRFTSSAATVSTNRSLRPGASGVSKITLSNTSNDKLDFILTLSQLANNQTVALTGGSSLTDNTDVTDIKMYLDNSGTGAGTYDSNDTLIASGTGIRDIAADGSATIWVVSTIPNSAANGQVAGFELKAQAATYNTATSTFSALNAKAADSLEAGGGVFFGDTQGASDSTKDGIYSIRDAFTVSAPSITAVWYKTIIKDPTSGNVDPKAIPGATVKYCLALTNATGAAEATDLKVSAPLGGVNFDPGFKVLVGGGVDSNGCKEDTLILGSLDESTEPDSVKGVIPTLAAGETRTVIFQTILK